MTSTALGATGTGSTATSTTPATGTHATGPRATSSRSATLAHTPDTGGFDPIGLDELNSAAALQTRVDRKYVVTHDEVRRVLAGLPAGTQVLDIDGRRNFGYLSVYFDTPELDSYLMAAHRRRVRFKVRHRRYLDTGSQWLEVKIRRNAQTAKHRAPADGSDLFVLSADRRSAACHGAQRGQAAVDPGTGLTSGPVVHTGLEATGTEATGIEYAGATLAAAGLGRINANDLVPVLTTEYRRSTLYLPGTASRITIDTGLTWTNTSDHEVGVPGLAIIETKSAGAVGPVDRLLWSLGRRPDRISKYATGMSVLHPTLPNNIWRRLIRSRIRPAI